MSKRKVRWVAGLCVILAAIAAICVAVAAERSDPYKETLIAYVEALKIGTEEAGQYAEFPNEDLRLAFCHSSSRIVDYEVESSEKINNSLWLYTMLIQDNMYGEVYRRIYYFVGHIDDRYVVYGNASFIPEDLRGDFDIAPYLYTSEDTLGVPETTS